MGFVLGLLGGGGSILTVPILFYIFGLDAVTSTAYSLIIVGTAAAVGAYRNQKKGNVDFKTGVLFALPALVGVFLARAYIVPAVPEEVVKLGNLRLMKDSFILIVFAMMMLGASYSMIMGRTEVSNEKVSGLPFRSLLGFGVGLATGFVGAGGGFIIVPVLNRFAGLSIKKAMGTSLLIISINAVVGFSGDLLTLEPDWFFLIKLTSVAILGVLAGTSFNSKFPAKVLKKLFGFFVLALGVVIVCKQVTSL